jgi:hypothetical protein
MFVDGHETRRGGTGVERRDVASRYGGAGDGVNTGGPRAGCDCPNPKLIEQPTTPDLNGRVSRVAADVMEHQRTGRPFTSCASACRPTK